MAQRPFTKTSSEQSRTEISAGGAGALEPKLELPDGSGFDPEPQRSNPDIIIAFCERSLPSLLTRPGFWERRQAERCFAEFDLTDPTKVPVTYPAEFIDELLRRE